MMLFWLLVYDEFNTSKDDFIISLDYMQWINQDYCDIVINNKWLYQKKNIYTIPIASF